MGGGDSVSLLGVIHCAIVIFYNVSPSYSLNSVNPFKSSQIIQSTINGNRTAFAKLEIMPVGAFYFVTAFITSDFVY